MLTGHSSRATRSTDAESWNSQHTNAETVPSSCKEREAMGCVASRHTHETQKSNPQCNSMWEISGQQNRCMHSMTPSKNITERCFCFSPGRIMGCGILVPQAGSNMGPRHESQGLNTGCCYSVTKSWFDSLQPHGLQHQLPGPLPFPGSWPSIHASVAI